MKQMKFLLILMLSTTVLAQSCLAKKNTGTFETFYDKYKKRDGFVSFNLPPSLAGLFTGKDDKELKQLLNSIDDVKFMIYDSKQDSVKYFAEELKRCLPSHMYDDLLLINSGGDNVAFKIQMKDDKVTELVILVIDNTGIFAMSVQGEMPLEKVKQIASSAEVNKIIRQNKHHS